MRRFFECGVWYLRKGLNHTSIWSNRNVNVALLGGDVCAASPLAPQQPPPPPAQQRHQRQLLSTPPDPDQPAARNSNGAIKLFTDRSLEISEWFRPLASRDGPRGPPESRIVMPLQMKNQTERILAHETMAYKETVKTFSSVCNASSGSGGGGIFVDSGANDGMWSLMASAYGCRAIAIEPQPLCCQYIAAASQENNLRVDIYNTLLAPSPGFSTKVRTDECIGTTQFLPDGRHADSWHKKLDHGRTAKQDLRSVALDELVPAGAVVELWHIDVEGAEVGVLRSAAKLFQEHRVKRVMLEWYPNRGIHTN